mmetsp:Transcript_3326/g.14494  ORF Transcript_3326/g.14494 Transcript_3326/m.14494 type:complete len:257 (+) Transcript_3326:1875-2645(+)
MTSGFLPFPASDRTATLSKTLTSSRISNVTLPRRTRTRWSPRCSTPRSRRCARFVAPALKPTWRVASSRTPHPTRLFPAPSGSWSPGWSGARTVDGESRLTRHGRGVGGRNTWMTSRRRARSSPRLTSPSGIGRGARRRWNGPWLNFSSLEARIPTGWTRSLARWRIAPARCGNPISALRRVDSCARPSSRSSGAGSPSGRPPPSPTSSPRASSTFRSTRRWTRTTKRETSSSAETTPLSWRRPGSPGTRSNAGAT